MKKNILCVIPARKGSKGLKNKNFKIFDKKRLIYYSLSKSIKIKTIDKIIFSSDSKNYINYVKKNFKKIDTILRNQKLANDNAKTFDVIYNVIKYYKKKNFFSNIIILLEPTSPLTPVKLIKKGLKILEKNYKKIDAVIPVVNLPKFNSIFSINVKKNFFVGKNFPNNTRRQKLDTFFLSGNFYISKVSSYIKNKGFYSKKTFAYKIDKKYYSDIDDIFDFREAEFKKKFFKLN